MMKGVKLTDGNKTTFDSAQTSPRKTKKSNGYTNDEVDCMPMHRQATTNNRDKTNNQQAKKENNGSDNNSNRNSKGNYISIDHQ